jgi:hypothetical protein
MSDDIGVLGEATATTVATTTVYTCPANMAAKVRLMFVMQGNAGGGTTLAILVNGLTIGAVAAMTASFYTFSIKGAGVRVAEQAAAPTGIGSGLTVAPADQIYYLNAGDTIQYTIGAAAAIAMNFQVVGVEIDLS